MIYIVYASALIMFLLLIAQNRFWTERNERLYDAAIELKHAVEGLAKDYTIANGQLKYWQKMYYNIYNKQQPRLKNGRYARKSK